MTIDTYTTIGDVRGACGHTHRTIAAAADCARRDDRDCKRGGGQSAYSDRQVVRTDGRALTDDEWGMLPEVA